MRATAFILFFCLSCADEFTTSRYNEVQVYSVEVCEFSITLKTKSFSSGRYDYSCEYEQAARFSNIPSDTIYYEATAGKKKTTGKVYHNGGITDIEIDF